MPLTPGEMGKVSYEGQVAVRSKPHPSIFATNTQNGRRNAAVSFDLHRVFKIYLNTDYKKSNFLIQYSM